MLETVKKRITLTKGDDGSVWLRPRYKDKSIYTVQEGDRAFFRINATKSVVEIECNVNVDANKIVVSFVPNDTKDLAPGIYRYEAELITSWGMHYTFLANETFILGAEIEKHISNASGNGNYGNNIPSVDGEIEDEPVVDGDIQPTNPSLDYETLNHLPKVNGNTLIGDKSNEQLGIPTKTSDLDNDSDFVSDSEYVHTDNNYDDTAKGAVDALGTASTYDVPESGNASNSQVVKGDDSRLRDNRDPNPHTHSKADITDFPTNVSAFNNDSGFITNTVNNLAYYYLKSETYTRAEVEQLIAAIKQGKFEIVAELPASGDANVIYLVPKSTAQTSNSYDEYVYINNAWEKIGDTDIDLSGYVTDDELTTALQSYLTTSAFNTAIASYHTKTETDNLLANKVDKVAGKGLSTNDYDNTAKGIVDGVTSALNDKVDKVQGKGLSTNDYDNTAKGIVDGVTNALAGKVDKENGKGLSTNDFTNTYKDKLDGISENANKVESSETNGNIQIDGTETQVYDDTEVKDAIEDIDDIITIDESTVEGNPINFTTKSAQNAKSTILSVEPIQDLHGYDKPWVGGAGKNKLPMTVDSIKAANTDGTWNGLVYTPPANTDRTLIITILVDEDNNVVGIKANGNCGASNYYFNISTNVGLATETNYNLTGTPSGLSGITSLQLQITGQSDIYDNAVDTQFVAHNSSQQLRIIFVLNKTVNNIVFYPMIRLSTESDATFQPYTNECGISGRTEIGILGCGKNCLDPAYNKVQIQGSFSDAGITYTYAGNGKIQLSNTATARSYGNLTFSTGIATAQPFASMRNKQFIFSCEGLITNVFVCWGYFKSDGTYAGNQSYNLSVSRPSVLVTMPDDIVALRFYIQVESGTAITTPITLSPMLRYYTVTNSNYEPYTESNNLTINLGQTVYGGTLDVENGVLVVENTIVTENDFEYGGSGTLGGLSYFNIPSNYPQAPKKEGYCSHLVYANSGWGSTVPVYCTREGASPAFYPVRIYDDSTSLADFKTKYAGLQVVYPLATPITINLTPHTINLLKGVNNISTDGDKITLTYRDGSVATLGDLTSAVDSLDSKIDESKILTDTVTGDKYILVVTNGVLDIQQISN